MRPTTFLACFINGLVCGTFIDSFPVAMAINVAVVIFVIIPLLEDIG